MSTTSRDIVENVPVYLYSKLFTCDQCKHKYSAGIYNESIHVCNLCLSDKKPNSNYKPHIAIIILPEIEYLTACIEKLKYNYGVDFPIYI